MKAPSNFPPTSVLKRRRERQRPRLTAAPCREGPDDVCSSGAPSGVEDALIEGKGNVRRVGASKGCFVRAPERLLPQLMSRCHEEAWRHSGGTVCSAALFQPGIAGKNGWMEKSFPGSTEMSVSYKNTVLLSGVKKKNHRLCVALLFDMSLKKTFSVPRQPEMSTDNSILI